MNVKTPSVNSKNKKFTLIAWSLVLLVLLIAIPFNLIFDRLDITFDMTPNSLYTLTDRTEAYLTKLDKAGVTVEVYFLADFEEVSEELELLAFYRTVLEYKQHPCFHFIDIDPDTNPELMRELNLDNVYNLSKYDMLFRYKDMVKRLPASMIYTYKTDENDNILSAEFRGENYITSYMASVVEGTKPTVYFLQGHGELAMEDITQLTANLGNYNYGTAALNLLNTEKVPDDACIVVIAGPQRDITEEEYHQLKDYADNGGNISFLMTPNEGKFDYTLIVRLMNSFCLSMDYNRIGETDSGRYASKDHSIFMCDLVAPESDEDEAYDLTSALIADKTVVTYMPASRSFYAYFNENYGTCKTGVLMKTQSTAYADACGGLNRDDDRVEGRELCLAMFSYDEQHKGKATVFGSAEFITNTGAASPFYINPLNLFLTSITWMYNSDIDMNISNKEKTSDSLFINSSEEASGMMALFIAIPVLVAAIGIIVWLRRKDA